MTRRPETLSRGAVLQRIQRTNHELDRLIAEKRFPLPIRDREQEVWFLDEIERWLRTGHAVKWMAQYSTHQNRSELES